MKWIVFDEADKLFEEQFVEQIDKILVACDEMKAKVCMFSATMLPEVERLARTVQQDPIKVVIGTK